MTFQLFINLVGAFGFGYCVGQLLRILKEKLEGYKQNEN